MTDLRGQITLDWAEHTRKTHPDTSFEAGEKITNSGKRLNHCQIILKVLCRHNGSTSLELASHTYLTHAQIWRRRKDLESNGYIYVEGVRDGYGIWWIK